ncbi:MAG: prepilin peptidase [Armatimonadetes bacterium]|nr:prepilin peptidase [Armatimonadota bacterium]
MPEAVRAVWTIGALLLGLCVGSFVNVLIFRLPRGRSVVAPRSHCFCCGTELAARDLIPVLSYLLAGRRCRYCGVALSAQYVWVEALCGLLYAGIAWRWGLTLPTFVYFVAAAAMLAGFGTDVRHKIIPSELNAAVFFAGLAGSLGGAAVRRLAPLDAPLLLGDAPLPTPGAALLGAVVGYLVFETIVRVGRRIFGQEAMGGGDVLLAAAVGTLLGPGRRFGAFFLLGILGGALVGVLLMLTGKLSRREPMPFGPFLIVAALVTLLWPQLGDAVARLYGFG